jgi:hypothetical protein
MTLCLGAQISEATIILIGLMEMGEEMVLVIKILLG